MSMMHGHTNDMADLDCGMSMLWNWDTVGTCFVAATWYNTTKAKFAGTVVGVFFLAFATEFLRCSAKLYDRRIIASQKAQAVARQITVELQPTWGQHVLRTLIHGLQFTGSYFVMLIGMYYNGPVFLALIGGHMVGYHFFGISKTEDAPAPPPTVQAVNEGMYAPY